jgi:hypothetical protein
MELVVRGVVSVPFHFEDEVEAVARLLGRYANVPMSFADAYLISGSPTLFPVTPIPVAKPRS